MRKQCVPGLPSRAEGLGTRLRPFMLSNVRLTGTELGAGASNECIWSHRLVHDSMCSSYVYTHAQESVGWSLH